MNLYDLLVVGIQVNPLDV